MKRRDFLFDSAIIAASTFVGSTALGKLVAPVNLRVKGLNAEADWQKRITGPGVVWYHDFRTNDEVNNFRWSPGFGNDPKAVSTNAGLVRRITTDGIGGGSCLEIVRPAGRNDGSVWWRPFSPILGGTTSGNGRGIGQNDPGAGGTLKPLAFDPTYRSQMETWGWKGFYGTSGAGPFDGSEYYLQVRVKMDPNRILGGNDAIDVGKLFYFTRNDRSATDQEIVVHSGSERGGKNYFNMYRSVSPSLASDAPGVAVHGDQPGTEYGKVGDGVCRMDNSGGRLANCWHWPEGQWATVMWRIRNGTNGGNNTLVEVWVAGPGEKTYTKIWNQPGVDLIFDSDFPQGHNALICSIYHNGEYMPLQFYHRYTQIIFSKQFIPCPQV